MITDFLIDLGRNLVLWFLGLFDSTWEIPSWMTGFLTTLQTFVANGANISVWVPWAVIGTVVAGNLALWAAGFLLRAVRWVVSIFPTISGGA